MSDIWETRWGKKIPINEMDDAHLKAAIELFETMIPDNKKPTSERWQMLMREKKRRSVEWFLEECEDL